MTARTTPTRPRRLVACVVFVAALGASACSDESPEPLTVADLQADATAELQLRNSLFSREGAAEWDDETRITAADVALYRTVATVYFSPELRRSVILQSLDDWDATAASLRTRLTQPDDTAEETARRDEVIEEFRAELERNVGLDDEIDVASFLRIPAVDRMIVELESNYASAGLGEFG